MLSGAALALLLVLGSAAAEDSPSTGGTGSAGSAGYVGLPLGALSELAHGVRGQVFAVDARTLYLKDLHYDGEGPAAYFYVGTAGAPGDASAVRLRDERGAATPLRRYRGAALTLALPDHLTLKDVRWFSLWCDDFSVNFGSISIPAGLQYPRPARLGALRGVHGVSSDPIVVVDAQTLLLPNFSYDGEAPDAKFWVGRGPTPSPQGIRIPDENGKETPLRRYDRKTIVLTLPGELTVFDIGHVGVWCEAFTVDFGHVPLPHARVANVPPSLKMLGVSPQSASLAAAARSPPAPPASAAPARARPRRPPTGEKLEATTYRPRRLGAGPAPALLAASPETSSLRRREYSQHSPHQLLQQHGDEQLEPQQPLPQAEPMQEQAELQSQLHREQPKLQLQQHQAQPQMQQQQEQSKPLMQQYQEQPDQQYQLQPQQLLYYKQTQPLEYQQQQRDPLLIHQQQRTDGIAQLLAQARALEQQRLEYEQLLLNIQANRHPLLQPQSHTQDSGAQIQGPGLQYRLVPYKYTERSFAR